MTFHQSIAHPKAEQGLKKLFFPKYRGVSLKSWGQNCIKYYKDSLQSIGKDKIPFDIDQNNNPA